MPVKHSFLRALVVLALTVGLLAGADDAEARRPRRRVCTPRLLVLSAFPGELDPLLAVARVHHTVTIDEREFYVGRLQGHPVVMALTGIGLVNAEQTARAAFSRFRCGDRAAISGVVFSGVAGGRYIGDVTVPARWTLDGTTWFGADPTMVATARQVADSVRLARDVPLGDPACVCLMPEIVTPVRLSRQPEVLVGGDGFSSDPFDGRRFPCIPGGGDVFGCDPCRMRTRSVPDAPRFLADVLPFVDPAFFLGYFENPPAQNPAYAAVDMETAAVARVAARNRRPFIAFRAMSDGEGDPLMLPGFPFQFFVYKQLAADNAAAMTVAFLDAWDGGAGGRRLR